MTVIAGAASRLHLGRIQQFIVLAKPVQMLGIGDIGRYASRRRRTIDLAALADLIESAPMAQALEAASDEETQDADDASDEAEEKPVS